MGGRASRGWVGTAAVCLATVAGCGTADVGPGGASGPATTGGTSTATVASAPSGDRVRVPDVVGTPAVAAGVGLGDLGLSVEQTTVALRCGRRPGTVTGQDPVGGTVVEPGAVIRLRTVQVEPGRFRGPCPAHVTGAVGADDVAVAKAFYRFAADPGLGAPFAPGDVWVGIESGTAAVRLAEGRRARLAAWRLGTGYAERGPVNPLDVLAASGGWFEVHPGVVARCFTGSTRIPRPLKGSRAVTLTAPADAVAACLDWWAVTLFLDRDDRIRGVAVRLGSP